MCLTQRYSDSRGISFNGGAAPTNPILSGPGSTRFVHYHIVGDLISSHMSLSAANVGIAMATGTDVAMEAAGITLVNRDLRSLPLALKLSRATLWKIKTNLFWAFAYNVVLIPVAALGLLSPILASVAMATSSLSVVTNSLLLKRIKLA